MAKGVAFGPNTAKRLLDIANANTRTDIGGVQGQPRVYRGPSSFLVRNDTAENVPPYGCMKIAGAELDANLDRYVIPITKPDGEGGMYLFNGEFEIEPSGFGQGFNQITRAYFVGETAPVYGDYLGPNTDWFLESAQIPALMVLGSLETELVYGQVNQGWPVRVRVLPTETISAGASGLCQIYRGTPLGASTQNEITVALDWEDGGEQVSAGKEATAEFLWHDFVWRLVSAECETDSEPASKTIVSESAPPSSGATAALYFEVDTGASSIKFKYNDNGTIQELSAPGP